jgi:hypothetical protein
MRVLIAALFHVRSYPPDREGGEELAAQPQIHPTPTFAGKPGGNLGRLTQFVRRHPILAPLWERGPLAR